MLKPPHTSYDRIYTYHLECESLPAISDNDLIGIWPEGTTRILFFHAPKTELIAHLCKSAGTKLVYQADLHYADWETGALPTTFSETGMTIAPVWEKNAPADLVIDPSVIFGNGFHPTTRLCLRVLLSLLDEQPGNIGSALDLGCGTGLLAMAAARRGIAAVTAVDHNPLACQVALANVKRNGVEDLVSVRCEDLFVWKSLPRAELVLANLHCDLLANLMGRDAFWQSAHFILSGFMPNEEERLLALLPAGTRFTNRLRQEKWCLWQLTRNSGEKNISGNQELSFFPESTTMTGNR